MPAGHETAYSCTNLYCSSKLQLNNSTHEAQPDPQVTSSCPSIIAHLRVRAWRGAACKAGMHAVMQAA
eukprot:973006-Pelagomonas_calceolata.AAC.5